MINLEDSEKEEMFNDLLNKLMDEMGGQDIHDRFDPEHSKLSPYESELDDGTIPTEGLMIQGSMDKEDGMPAEVEMHAEPLGGEDEDEDASPFTRDIFKKKG